MDDPEAIDIRRAATALLPDGMTGLALVPSPPADNDPAWFADDPTSRDGLSGTVVSPTSDGDITWARHATEDPSIEAFARQHWLGPLDRLPQLPPTFAQTRAALHQVSFFAIAPARHAATGKLGLRWTPGGFGTPFFAADDGDRQIRVDGDLLVVQTADQVRSTPLTTVRDACAFLDVDYAIDWFPDFHDPLSPADPDADLLVDTHSVGALNAWFGFATNVLEELRRTDGAVDVGRVQLWPEHFDPAVELGDADAGHRASYGASPGDAGHATPYLYISAWGTVDDDPFWNAEGFAGALLPYDTLLSAEDQRATAMNFLRQGHARLNR